MKIASGLDTHSPGPQTLQPSSGVEGHSALHRIITRRKKKLKNLLEEGNMVMVLIFMAAHSKNSPFRV
jgi:hypothetical protein